MDKPVLSKQAFWDVDMDKIDYEKHALYVIENILNDGSFDDFIAIRKFYGDDKIKQEIIYSKELGPKEINFRCRIFNLNSVDFKYPANRPAYPASWDYSGS